MSSEEEEERLTYAELCQQLAKQDRARIAHSMKLPTHYEIPLIVKRTMEETVKNQLHLYNLYFQDYTEPKDTECYFLAAVSPANVHFLEKLDPQFVCFQTPDLLLPC